MTDDPTEATLIRIAKAMERTAEQMERLVLAQRDQASTLRAIEAMVAHSNLNAVHDDGNGDASQP